MHTSAEIVVRSLDAAEAEHHLGELAHILVDAVAHGASVNFLHGLEQEQAKAYWHAQLPSIAAGHTHLIVADNGTRLVGTILLFAMQQPNQPHRAEIGKTLVLSTHRRQGLGRRLLAAAENKARSLGRSLLMLDTTTGSDGDKLYRHCGWTAFGEVPGHALTTGGEPSDTTFFFKQLIE